MISVIEAFTLSVWAWTPFLWVAGSAIYAAKTFQHLRRKDKQKHQKRPNNLQKMDPILDHAFDLFIPIFLLFE